MALEFQATFDFLKIPPQNIWKLLRSTHPQMLADNVIVEMAGGRCTVADVDNRIAKKGKPYFDIGIKQMTFTYSQVGPGDHALLWLVNCIEDTADAWRWCEPFAALPEFRQAFVYDSDFQRWQNEEDPEAFADEGRDHGNLPKKSNNLPDFVESDIIDISGNPGRRMIREGYLEFVSSLMWLGKPFWKLTGASRNKVLEQDWLKCKELSNNVLQVHARNKPFVSAEGEQGAMQDRLRDLLFPHHGKHESLR